jgi:hypothetical protein
VRHAGVNGVAAARLWQQRHITSKESARLAERYSDLVRVEKKGKRIFYFWNPLPSTRQVIDSSDTVAVLPEPEPVPGGGPETVVVVKSEVPAPAPASIGKDAVDAGELPPIDPAMCWRPACPGMSRARRHARGSRGFDRERTPMPGALP